jgi:hypothetical protein
MAGRLRRLAGPAIGSACVLTLILSFVIARAGDEPQPDGPVVPAIPASESAAATPASLLGRADGLPALAPEPPKPEPTPVRAPAPPAPAPAPPPAPARDVPPPEPEAAYTPPPVPVTPAPPPPTPAPQPAPPPEPDPAPPVYFDDSG